MARLQKHRRSKALPSVRISSRLRNPLRRAVSGPRRILRYLFGSRKKHYSWTLFHLSTAEPFFITPTSPSSMQIHLDLDGEGGISGNTRGSHSPHRGVDGLQVRNRRSVVVSDSSVGSLSFTPKTFRVGESPGGGRRSGADRSSAGNGFASLSDSHGADSDSDDDSEKDLWLLTYKYFRNQNHGGAARKGHVSITSSATSSSSKDTASSSSDRYRTDFDLEADPWLLTYNFLNSINNEQEDSALQPATVNKEPKNTISDGRSLRRKHHNEDMRAQWARNNDDDACMPPILHRSTDNEVQNPALNDNPAPPTQYSRLSNPPPPSIPPLSNPLPTKYFPTAHTHLSHQGSGSRYPPPPPPNLHIRVPALETPLPDPEPPTPLPTMQNFEFEAIPLSDGAGESGVIVNWQNSREENWVKGLGGIYFGTEDQRPNTSPNGGIVRGRGGGSGRGRRRCEAYAQEEGVRGFMVETAPLVMDRFPTVLRAGQASRDFNAHLNFSFDRLTSSGDLHPVGKLPAHGEPISQAASPPSSSSPSPPPPPPTTTPLPHPYPPSPPPNLTNFSFPFEHSHSPSLEEKIDDEYKAALGRWSGESFERRVRRSRDVRECMRRLRECTAFEGGNGDGGWDWDWGF